jgi:3-deoxy-D-manno-octulosonate 8-phosphate phosphatase (KDO 8-P phosphatase)
MQQIIEKARKIRLLVLDVDGVLTDGRLYFNETGGEIKAFNSLDGHGIKMLQSSGIETAIITGRNTQLVAKRARDLGITHLYQGREDKLTALRELWEATEFSPQETAYVGDDWPDLPAIRASGLGITVANGNIHVIEHAHWCTTSRGGEGAVREVCEFIMSAQGSLESALAPYLTDPL